MSKDALEYLVEVRTKNWYRLVRPQSPSIRDSYQASGTLKLVEPPIISRRIIVPLAAFNDHRAVGCNPIRTLKESEHLEKKCRRE